MSEKTGACLGQFDGINYVLLMIGPLISELHHF